jgi:hypothetical protein
MVMGHMVEEGTVRYGWAPAVTVESGYSEGSESDKC